MSSSMALLAYVLRRPEPEAATRARLTHADTHLARLGLVERGLRTHDQVSGLLTWRVAGGRVSWRADPPTDEGALAWLHVPGHQETLGERELAEEVIDGTVDVADLTPPFAVLRWQPRTVEVRNDLLGLVRLFHYPFPQGDVWTTRMGLAHVFMGAAPRAQVEAWQGMTAIGWAPAGRTQLGEGQHLAGGTHVRAQHLSHGVQIDLGQRFAPWAQQARRSAPASDDVAVRQMRDVMRSALHWPEPPQADLSGGKDSRLIAAVGISAGAVRAVRTVRTDHGELETARRLVTALHVPVEHIVVDRSTTARPDAPPDAWWEDLVTHHAAWEGRYLPSAAFGARPFAHFSPRRRAHFNGLGGEVLAGGALWAGAWRERLVQAPPATATDRIRALAAASRIATPAAVDATVAGLSTIVQEARDAGATTAGGVMDLVYLRDRMPHWVNIFTSDAVVCPLFAPALLARAAHTIGAPVPDGELHRRLISRAVPEWADVPFYKPGAGERLARPRVWELTTWPDVRARLVDAVAASQDVRPDTLGTIDRAIEDGTAGKVLETVIHRCLWRATFDVYLERLAEETDAAARAIHAAGATA